MDENVKKIDENVKTLKNGKICEKPDENVKNGRKREKRMKT